ncbi:MAG TPA: glycosyltransferase family 2 protein [Verrucomicrobiae bacterium]|nr:glycosyltransferase family 2 protein [Verrucomicrobiae bacterium]
MADAPAITVVLPCRNEAARIKRCVQSLLAQQNPPGGYEIVAVDGQSTDGTRDILQGLSSADYRLRVLENPAKITPCGMNCGIRAARGAWIAIMGAHNRYAPDYLAKCLEVAQTTGADNVGGAMFTEAERAVQQAVAAAHHSPFSVGGARWHNPTYEGPADTVFGGFYRKDVFDRIGLFDEELVRDQDDELNLRLVRAGGRIWQSPGIRSWYCPRGSFSAVFSQYAQYGYWKVRVIQKHHLPASWRHLVPGIFVFLFLTLPLSAGLLYLTGCCYRILWQQSPVNLAGGLMFTLWLCLASAYSLGLLGASVLSSWPHRWKLLPILPIVFACYHFGYGYGFLRGLLDFVIRRKQANPRFQLSTRSEPSTRRA